MKETEGREEGREVGREGGREERREEGRKEGRGIRNRFQLICLDRKDIRLSSSKTIPSVLTVKTDLGERLLRWMHRQINR